MNQPISLFICYKKQLEYERDGKKYLSDNEKAGILNLVLSEAGNRFEPWMDEAEIAGGMEWEKAIYNRILVSDVMLVLIGPGTHLSPWVRREIALAEAVGVSVVPLGFDLDRDQMDEELRQLDIAKLQGKITQNIRAFPKSAHVALLSEIQDDLEKAAVRTAQTQKAVLEPVLERRKPAPPREAAFSQRAATFQLPTAGRAVALHIASGDLMQVRGIDVLVNSENDYMQMARAFEGRTISSVLRHRGAWVRDGRYVDTIQVELDRQVGD